MVNKNMKNINTTDDVAVYIATHGPKCEIVPDYCIPIEIGAALHDKSIYNIRDNSGEDNISIKDKLYGEITALYWIWKNDTHKIVGLCHYRRITLIKHKNIIKYLNGNYDILMFRNRIRFPKSYEAMYISSNDHIPSDWQIMKDVLRKKYPDYYQSAELVFQSHYYYKCNIFISNNQFLNNYCNWLFPLIEEIESKINLNGRVGNQVRVIGYLCEILLNVYVVHNEYKIKNIPVYYLQKKLLFEIISNKISFLYQYPHLHYFLQQIDEIISGIIEGYVLPVLPKDNICTNWILMKKHNIIEKIK